MENNFFSGGIEELQQAKEAVVKSEELQAALNAAAADASGKEKALSNQQKYITDKVDSIVRDRRAPLKKQQDENVDAASKNLKEAEKKRRMAKNNAVQARISNETADLVDTNEQLKKETKAMFSKNKVPGFCNTRLYYALYAPKRAGDYLILIATVLITLGVIPNIVCLFLQDSKLIVKILVYIAIVVFFVGIYFLVFAISKRNTNGNVLEMARPNRDTIRKNRKMVNKRSRSIERDKDESGYGLEGYDSEIENLQQILNETIAKREETLKNFDTVTVSEIRAEVERENQPVIDQMTADLNLSRQALDQANIQAKEASDALTQSYEVYLGKKNLSAEKIDEMITMIQEGKANTVMEALDLLKGELK